MDTVRQRQRTHLRPRLSDAGYAELLLRTAKLPEPEDPETTLPDDRKSDLSVRHPSSSSIY